MYKNKRTKKEQFKNERESHLQSMVAPPISGRPKHNDGYVVIKLSHPKRRFSEKDYTKSSKDFDQSLGYVKKRKYHVWTNNPKTEYTGPRERSTALTVRINDYYSLQLTESKKIK